MPPATLLVIFVLYSFLLLGLFWFAFLQRKRRREGKFPVPDDVRAMRCAGEQLSHDLVRLGERFDIQFLMLLVLPLLGFGFPLWLMKATGSAHPVGVLVACGALFLAVLIIVIRQLLATTEEIRDKRLALFGERVTGDRLMDLTNDGYAVFHDVPCLGGGGTFNLDHVVVGRGSVVVVETKTYRKRSGPNGEGHKVTYDGKKLIWPDGTSTDVLTQVLDGAEWLRKELQKKLNLDVSVCAALTMPGWYVIGGPSQAPVLVENTKRLPTFIRERFQGGMSAVNEELVRRHLRSLCETVSFAGMAD
jgi:hypothetical protein